MKNAPKYCERCGAMYQDDRVSRANWERRRFCSRLCAAVATVDERGGKGACILKHGCARTSVRLPEYVAWHMIQQRCENSKVRCYPIYGGRGIKMCERWRTNFVAFYQDMGPRPSAKHSIDRVNPDGDYEPINCRWATTREQANNKRKNRRITLNKRTMTVAEWSRETGIGRTTIHYRLKAGWSTERILDARDCRSTRRLPNDKAA